MKHLIELMDLQQALSHFVAVGLPDALDAGLYLAEREAALGLLKEIRLSAIQAEKVILVHGK